MKPHKHAELIKAWADGAEIERYNSYTGEWRLCPVSLDWNECSEYRIKSSGKNRRIKELASQVELTIRDQAGNTYMSHPEFDKKFAELIVKECAGVAEVSMPMHSHPDDRLKVKNSILKHFGVE